MQSGYLTVGIDGFTAVIIGRCVYIAFKNGSLIEFFKLAGAVFAAFVSFHYYSSAAQFFLKSDATHSLVHAGVFVVLWLVVMGLFKLVRDGVQLLIAVELHSIPDHTLAVLMGVIRGSIVAGLVWYTLLLMPVVPLQQAVVSSWSGPSVMKASVKCYQKIHGFLLGTLFKEEPFNEQVTQVLSPAAPSQSQQDPEQP
jgi:uncharacterized membrane protein required for colicin V production